MREFTKEVLRERARLAIEDPAGEKDALHPLTEEKARRIIRHLTDCWQPPRLSHPAPTGRAAQRNILERLGCDLTKDSGVTHCPGPLHRRGDLNMSLSWKWNGERALLHCFAGCDFRSIRDALG